MNRPFRPFESFESLENRRLMSVGVASLLRPYNPTIPPTFYYSAPLTIEGTAAADTIIVSRDRLGGLFVNHNGTVNSYLERYVSKIIVHAPRRQRHRLPLRQHRQAPRDPRRPRSRHPLRRRTRRPAHRRRRHRLAVRHGGQ